MHLETPSTLHKHLPVKQGILLNIPTLSDTDPSRMLSAGQYPLQVAQFLRLR